jgi:hypothetical protein
MPRIGRVAGLQQLSSMATIVAINHAIMGFVIAVVAYYVMIFFSGETLQHTILM